MEPPLTAQSNGSDKKEDSGDGSKAGSRQGSAKSNRSNASGKAGNIATPITSAKDNPAADMRNMRRIIAEDPEWSLATVPLLTELCISHIVNNFESKTFRNKIVV